MAIDFPNSPPPESGDVYTGPNGVSYTFDGIKWIGQEMGSGGGGAGLPDQSGQAGKFLTTDGNGNASWADAQGPKGDAATIAVGTVATGLPGSDVIVGNSGDSSAAIFDFTIPQGDKGDKGDQGDKGDTGDKGDAATIAVGTVTTGVAGSSVIINNSGDTAAAVFDFTIPRGDKGDAATVAVGTVTTGAAGSSTVITNTGNANDAVFAFTIPRGDQGIQGVRGLQGETGAAGAQGSQGAAGQTGSQGPAGQKGDQGIPGNDGATGATGSPGAPGAAGAKGDPGATGPKGDKGDQGIPGNDSTVQGPKGDTGAQGVSVTLQGTKATIADLPPTGSAGQGWIVTTGDVGAGHLDGSLWFWNVSAGQWDDIGPIVGPKGDKGDPGDQGAKGDQGEPGNDGAAGADGAKGDTGETGPRGDPGEPGASGAKGDQGEPGEKGDTGAQGEPGAAGAEGPAGPAGAGVSTGGAPGQVLAKLSGDDYDTGWVNQITETDRLINGDYSLILDVDGKLTTPGSVDFGGQIAKLDGPQPNGTTDLLTLWNFNGGNPQGEYYNYAIGVEGNHVWFAQDTDPTTQTGGFKFYSRGQQAFKIAANGDLMFKDGSIQTTAYTGATRWDATPTEPGNNCPIFAELTPDHFYAYTQRSHLELQNDGTWFVGSNANATGLYGLNNDTTLFSNRGNVVIRTGENDLKYFTFASNGGLTFPDDTTQYTAWQGATITSATAPTDSLGRLWYNSTDGRTYIKYNDQWVDANPPVVPHVSTYLDGLVVDGTTIATTEIDADITVQEITFTADGRIQLPLGGDIVDSLGNSVLGGGTVDLGKFVFGSDGDSAFIQTTDDAGASPNRYDIVLVPGGEGNSSIRVPSQANSLAGFPLVIEASAANSAVVINTENGTSTFDSNGNFRPANHVIALNGRFIQDCADGTTSMRWVNATPFGVSQEDIELVRVYRDGGSPYAGDQNEREERVQLGYVDIDTDVSAYYISTTKNPLGLFVNPEDDKRWEFQGTGGLKFPDGSIQNTAWNGQKDLLISDTPPTDKTFWFNSTDGRLYINTYDEGALWVDASPPVVPPTSTYLDGLTVEGTTIATVEINAPITVQEITFTADGRIRLPAGGDIVDSFDRSVLVNNNPTDRLVNGANSLVLGTNGALTLPSGYSIKSSNIGDGIAMTTDRGTVLFGNWPEAAGQVEHFHIMKGYNQDEFRTPQAIDLFFGDDFNYVKLPSTPNLGVEIGTYDFNEYGSNHIWRFNTDGNLTVPEDGGIFSQPGRFVALASDAGAEVAWVNPSIFSTLGTGDFSAIRAGDVIETYAGADEHGVYLSQVVADSDGATTAHANTWGVNSDGNLFTENIAYTFFGGPPQVVDLPPSDIVDTDGNSLIRAAVGTTAPGAWAKEGHQWYNSTDGRTYIKVAGTWVEANPPVVAPVSTYLSGLTIDEQTISSVDYLKPDVKIAGNLLPDEDLTYDLGSATNQWNSLYIKDTTIYMSGRALSLTSEGLKVDGQAPITVLDGGHADTWLLPV